MTKFLNISTDNTLGGNSPSDVLVASQKAIKEYVDSQGSGSGYHPDLFDVKWADHICNDVQWLRADTFSWQSSAVYQAAYAHLVLDILGKTLQSETVAGTTIQFYLADDGHKICPASEESNVSAIYNATGVAWYYIIDTANTRFKLPRTQFAFTGIRNSVGGFVEAGLPNITGEISDGRGGWRANTITTNGCITATSANGGNVGSGYGISDIKIDASLSSSVYGNSDTVQPKATEMYLYFYVGNFTQTALENTAGITTEEMNNKVDKGHQVVEFQEPTAANNYTWYRKYADGWVEQGGYIANNSTTTTVTLPVPMKYSNYTLVGGLLNGTSSATYEHFNFNTLTTTSFKFLTYDNYGCEWLVMGMAA